MDRPAILTGGGNAPGLNAAIRAVVKTAIHECDCEILGVKNDYNRFLAEGGVFPLNIQAVRDILPRGGTIH